MVLITRRRFAGPGDLAGAKKSELESLAIQRPAEEQARHGVCPVGAGELLPGRRGTSARRRIIRGKRSVRNEIGEKHTEAEEPSIARAGALREGRPICRRSWPSRLRSSSGRRSPIHGSVGGRLPALSLAVQKEIASGPRRPLTAGRYCAQNRNPGGAVKHSDAAGARERAAGQTCGRRAHPRSVAGRGPRSWGWLPSIQYRLALEAGSESGNAAKGRARLASLRSDASGKGYGLIAARAGK